MAVGKGTLYIKADQCVEVKNRDVTLGDLIEMECADPQVVFKLKTIKVMKMPDQGKHRYVLSILKIIESIHKEYPNLEIQNMGAPDVIVVYEAQKKNNAIWQWTKVVLVCLLSFVGAALTLAHPSCLFRFMRCLRGKRTRDSPYWKLLTVWV